jgi:O-antigen ligase|tara:strand:+ start:1192 stop:2427 length:1236 start_codon:yes stop_codon:yes gene_type:complete
MRLFEINKIDLQSLWKYSLLLVAFTIPIGSFVNSVSIIILFLFSFLIRLRSSSQFSLRNFISKINISAIYILLILIGLLYSSNLDVGIKVTLRSLAFLVIPISFALSYNSTFSLEKVLLTFAISIFSLFIFTHINVLLELFRENDNFSLLISHYLRNNFIKHSLVQIHAPYFGMFSVFAFVIVLKSKLLNNYLKVIMGSYILFCIFLISAVTSIIVLGIIIFVMVIKLFLKKKLMNRIMIFAIFLSSILSFYFVKQIDVTNSSNVVIRIEKLIKKSGDSDRAENWESIFRLPIKNLLFGVGTGDELDEIQKVRNHKGWAWAYRHNANMHNQYLEVLLRNGILGLTIFLLVFINLWKRLKKYNDFRYLSFLLLIIISFMTESMLERQWGIVFFVFFLSVFIFAHKDNQNFLK